MLIVAVLVMTVSILCGFASLVMAKDGRPDSEQMPSVMFGVSSLLLLFVGAGMFGAA